MSDRLRTSEGKNYSLLFPFYSSPNQPNTGKNGNKSETKKERKKLAHRQTHIGTLGKKLNYV